MIIEFSISNFRSYKQKQTLSMLPSSRIKDNERMNQIKEIEGYPNLEVLPIAAIYGKNNAGKTNIIRAFKAIQWLVLMSHKFQVGQKLIPNETFAFDFDTQTGATVFEIEFIATDGVQYLLLIEFTKEKILREELYRFMVGADERTHQQKLYIREYGKPIDFGGEFKGEKKSIEKRLIDNVLFLSKGAQENHEMLKPIVLFFREKIEVVPLTDMYTRFQLNYLGRSVSEEKGKEKLSAINRALNAVDTGIVGLASTKLEELPDDVRVEIEGKPTDEEEVNIARERILDLLKHKLKARHKFFNDLQEDGTVEIPLEEESEGTQKFVALFAKFIDLANEGGIFIVDELERSFHPLLTKKLIQLFMTSVAASKNAQLIFTTYATEIISDLDRDQVYLLEKNEFGATEIFPVSSIPGIRKEASIKKLYMESRIEGIPNIDNYQLTQIFE